MGLLCLGFAVAAAVHALGAVGQHKHLRQLLLGGGDAAGVLAADDVRDLLGQFRVHLADFLSIANDADRDLRADEAEDILVELDDFTDLDDVFPSQLLAGGVFDDGFSRRFFFVGANAYGSLVCADFGTMPSCRSEVEK